MQPPRLTKVLMPVQKELVNKYVAMTEGPFAYCECCMFFV
jgi:hypothetical protein